MLFWVGFERKLPAGYKPEVPCHVVFSAKKKGLENIQALLIGGAAATEKHL